MAFISAARPRAAILRQLLHRLFSSSVASPPSATTAAVDHPTVNPAISTLILNYGAALLRHLLRPLSSSATTAAVDRPTVDPAIITLIRAGRISTVATLLDRRLTSPSALSDHDLASLILNYGAAGLLDEALGAFSSPSASAPRTALSLNALLSAYNRSRKHLHLVPELFLSLSSTHSIAPDSFTYGALIKSLCRTHRTAEAIAALREMDSKNIPITTVHYTTILDSMYKERMSERAALLWEEMLANGCAPDLIAYNVRAQHGTPNDILALIEEMKTADIQPDLVTYFYLMASYFKQDRMEEGLKVYKELGKKGCKANMVIYQYLLSYLCKKGEFVEAVEVFAESMRENMVPDFGTVMRLVTGLMKNGKVPEAKKMVRGLSEKYDVELTDESKKKPQGFTGEWKKKLEQIVGLEDGEEWQQ